ncbi:hypothetical protein G7046_g2173 [Stylonectria norvegica]|nr:hypothetical protein G7046_g2173 [Stylonectria norvegica]
MTCRLGAIAATPKKQAPGSIPMGIPLKPVPKSAGIESGAQNELLDPGNPTVHLAPPTNPRGRRQRAPKLGGGGVLRNCEDEDSCTLTRLAEALVERFEYVGESPSMCGPIRLGVYNVFKGWLEELMDTGLEVDSAVGVPAMVGQPVQEAFILRAPLGPRGDGDGGAEADGIAKLVAGSAGNEAVAGELVVIPFAYEDRTRAHMDPAVQIAGPESETRIETPRESQTEDEFQPVKQLVVEGGGRSDAGTGIRSLDYRKDSSDDLTPRQHSMQARRIVNLENLPESFPLNDLKSQPSANMATSQPVDLAKLQTVLRAKDDTQRFAALAHLKSVLDSSPDLRGDEAVVQSLWASLPPTFLDMDFLRETMVRLPGPVSPNKEERTFDRRFSASQPSMTSKILSHHEILHLAILQAFGAALEDYDQLQQKPELDLVSGELFSVGNSQRTQPLSVILKVKRATTQPRNHAAHTRGGAQIILVSFLQKVMFDERMTELEYEMFNGLWKVIGISPDFYEIMLRRGVVPDGETYAG